MFIDYLMLMFCESVKRDSVSFLRLSFCFYAQAFSSEIWRLSLEIAVHLFTFPFYFSRLFLLLFFLRFILLILAAADSLSLLFLCIFRVHQLLHPRSSHFWRVLFFLFFLTRNVYRYNFSGVMYCVSSSIS